MNRTPFRDIEQTLPLGVVEVSGQLHIQIDVGDPPFDGLALGAVFCMNALVPQKHSNPLERPSLAIRVHPHGHGGTCPESREQ